MKKILLFIFIALVSVSIAAAQGLRDVRINEILVKNVNSYTNDFGEKVGWIELYNTGYASANLAGAYLSLVSEGDTIDYRIPKNDSRTLIPPQGYVIFFAEGTSNKGTFYTNFILGSVLDSAATSVIETVLLKDQSGSTVVYQMEYDVCDQVEDVSYGYVMNYETSTESLEKLTHITPLQSNDIIEPISKSEIFNAQDPAGIAMAATAMSVVFSALILLYLIFKFMGRFMSFRRSDNVVPAVSEPTELVNSEGLTGEEIVAIALAINLYEDDLHDIESNVVTINKVARAYSPWSSKIYGLRQVPIKR